MTRAIGFGFGALTHGLFAYTVWKLVWFLTGPTSATPGGLAIDLVLSIQFGAIHSTLLLPRVRDRLTASCVPSPLYGCFYCAATCLSLLTAIFGWRSCGPVLWELAGPARNAVQAAFIGSWIALFYSLSLTGLGYQTGFTPWWNWLRRGPALRREFQPRSLYRVLRHPVYLSFLGLIWFTPVMTLDHALLTGVWTAYIFAGSYLKDQRLAHYVGDAYRVYQERVTGYPGMFFGPLAKVKRSDSSRRSIERNSRLSGSLAAIRS